MQRTVLTLSFMVALCGLSLMAVHGDLQILEHFWGLHEIVIRSVDRGELDRKGGDHRESVPFSCGTAGCAESGDATVGRARPAHAIHDVLARRVTPSPHVVNVGVVPPL